MQRYDFVVLGGGNAGLAASTQVAAAGRTVMLVDPTPIGGVCSLRGCTPKKVLVRATEMLQEIRNATVHGIHVDNVRIDWNAVIDRKHGFTDGVTEATERSLAAAGVHYLRAAPRFVAPDQIEAGGERYAFEGALVATGSAPRPLRFPGAQHLLTSDALLELRRVPRTLVIVGSGAVAFEFAHVFARLGSEVHVIAHSQRLLPHCDEEMVSHLVEHSMHLGIVFHRGREVTAIEHEADGHAAVLDTGERLKGEVMLNAAGRIPQVAALGLDAAGVAAGPEGVVVNEHLRSPGNPNIFAAGDARGQPMLSPTATYEGRLAAHNFLSREQAPARLDAVPQAIFTVPPLAMVGESEAMARERGSDVDVVAEEMSHWVVPSIAAAGPAFGKVISDRRSGRILGAHLFGQGADETIHIFAMAIRYGITCARLTEMIPVYPSHASTLHHLLPGCKSNLLPGGGVA
ncbi:MAG: NAD(P)/FAD-dependent oxidoreductase [Betaproteobacteria bacterium]|nr:NAD(P)/FAD-dependent oxidoreductase [Betaproteobacteria bacterium]